MTDQAEIHKNCISKKIWDRRKALELLKIHFSNLSDQDQAWQDLHRLTQDKDIGVRGIAVYALRSTFSHVPNKDQAWQDLHRLTQDKDNGVREIAAYALGSTFSHFSDQDLAWQDLHRLTQDKDKSVRRGAAYALGSAFILVPNKDQAWQDLHRLTQDKKNIVRMHAYHSLGRASVFKATETADEDTLKKELEAAVAYFEKSIRGRNYSPARFCYPFYRTYLAITFQGAKEEVVQRYLVEAKAAVRGSRSRDLLLKAVENLAHALVEVQKQSQASHAGGSWEEIQKDLKDIYEPYCNRAAELLDEVEDMAPGATKCVRKALPIIDDRIRSTITEIQDKSRSLCRASHGSEVFSPLGTDLNRLARGLSSKDVLKCLKLSLRMVPLLRELCKNLSTEKRGHGCEIVEEIRLEDELPGILNRILEAITYLQPNIELTAHESGTNQILMELVVVNSKLDEIRYAIFKQSIRSGNVISNLTAIKTELEKLYQMSLQHPNVNLKELYSCREEQLQELSRDMDDRFAELKDILKDKASTDDAKKILDAFGRPSDTWNSKFWVV